MWAARFPTELYSRSLEPISVTSVFGAEFYNRSLQLQVHQFAVLYLTSFEYCQCWLQLWSTYPRHNQMECYLLMFEERSVNDI